MYIYIYIINICVCMYILCGHVKALIYILPFPPIPPSSHVSNSSTYGWSKNRRSLNPLCLFSTDQILLTVACERKLDGSVKLEMPGIYDSNWKNGGRTNNNRDFLGDIQFGYTIRIYNGIRIGFTLDSSVIKPGN